MKSHDTAIVNWYLVAFLDILGQKNLLHDLKALPIPNSKEQLEFVDLLKKTAGSVELLRNLFHKYFDAYNRSSFDVSKLPKEQLRVYKKLKGNPLKSTMFSDFVTLVLSLHEDKNLVPMSSVFSTIFSAASVFITMLAGRKVIRGGIDVGIGLELKNGDVYGSALSRAYELESNIAKYPRIVIGDELVKYLQAQRKRPNDTPFSDMNKQLAQLCQNLISIDEDGYPFIDFLGKEFKNIASDRGGGDIL